MVISQKTSTSKDNGKTKRKRHPGVVILKPEPERRIGWRLRFRDPDDGKLKKEAIPEAEARRADTREDAAVRKYKAISRRALELEQPGTVRKTGTGLEKAVKRYYDDHPRLRPTTLLAYKGSTDKFLKWAKAHGVKSCDDLTRGKLMAFRAEVIKEPKTVIASKGKRGQRRRTPQPRSPYSINRDLRGVRTVLGYLRKLDLLPHLSSDGLGDGLQRLKVDHERLAHLKPNQLRKALQAALAHDAEVFKATRREHAKGLGRMTPKYDAIAPLTMFVMLSGVRLGETFELDWDDVDLDALDHQGNKVGEIHLEGASNKTHRARTVGLEVSPALRALLAALKLRSGGEGKVFPITRPAVQAATKRLLRDYGAPKGFGWQAMRRTCGTFLTNAPGIYGAASAFMSARQLGHSVTVAEKHYVGVVRGISPDVRTLEEAMQVTDEVQRVIDSVSGERTAVGKVLAIR